MALLVWFLGIGLDFWHRLSWALERSNALFFLMHHLIIALPVSVLLLLCNLLSLISKVWVLLVNLIGWKLVIRVLDLFRENLDHFLLLTLRVLDEHRLCLCWLLLWSCLDGLVELRVSLLVDI